MGDSNKKSISNCDLSELNRPRYSSFDMVGSAIKWVNHYSLYLRTFTKQNIDWTQRLTKIFPQKKTIGL